MPLPEPTFAPYNEHKIAYYSYGSGSKAVVFVHGWTCDSALWEPQQPLFTKFKRTVLVDYIGHGNSDAPDIDYSNETFARSIKAALDHAEVEKATVVAHSMGGPVTTMLLRLHPELVKGIIYVDSFFRLPESYLTNEELASVRERNKSDEKFAGFIRWMMSSSTQDVQDKVVHRMVSTPVHVRISATGTTTRPHHFRYDEIYNIPALHMGTVFKEMDPFWKHHMPQIVLEEEKWKDCGHFVFLDQPERFNEAVEGWIREKGFM